MPGDDFYPKPGDLIGRRSDDGSVEITTFTGIDANGYSYCGDPWCDGHAFLSQRCGANDDDD